MQQFRGRPIGESGPARSTRQRWRNLLIERKLRLSDRERELIRMATYERAKLVRMPYVSIQHIEEAIDGERQEPNRGDA